MCTGSSKPVCKAHVYINSTLCARPHMNRCVLMSNPDKKKGVRGVSRNASSKLMCTRDGPFSSSECRPRLHRNCIKWRGRTQAGAAETINQYNVPVVAKPPSLGFICSCCCLSRSVAKFCHAPGCPETRSTRVESGHCGKPQSRFPRSCHEVRQMRPVFCQYQYADNVFQLTYVHLSLPTHIKILTLSDTFTS